MPFENPKMWILIGNKNTILHLNLKNSMSCYCSM